MTFFEQISEDIKVSMKEKNKVKLDALRYLKAMLIENKTSAKPIEEKEVLIKHYKKMSDSLSMLPSESENHQKLVSELAVLKEYMPEELTEEKVREIISEIVASLPNKNFGLIMKELSPKIKGRFDGKRASDLAKEYC